MRPLLDASCRPRIAPLLVFLGTVMSGVIVAGIPPACTAAREAPAVADNIEESSRNVRSMEGRTMVFPLPDSPDRPLMVLDSRLADRMADMARRSRKWRVALETIRAKRFPVLVGTIIQVERKLPALEEYGFDGPAATWFFSDDRGRPVAAAVTVNLPKLVIRSRVLGDDGVRLRRMLELHLTHEIYGHLTPVVETGNLDHPCRLDPSPEAPEEDQRRSCVMRREGELLLDLGYEPRDTYLWNYWEDRIEKPRPEQVEGSDSRAGPG